ncbi:pentapeptide repeat-containing protein [Planomicrobium sp. CPCC 101110]|uniref:pentapeptide repeat-containing protein n=1 Tax=Planomicrobium sp. CPCC 101110 TaxID=2599619 RepID=UPI0011B72D49|nr:pentapeptide repeat-containing protein [Planomicrobium sp. CPCC 101110]TWT25854.1 pentapeptide repeat-containing protein [Planomicrobium sp. CPCC 101110]
MTSTQPIEPIQAKEIRASLKADCSQCFGLCCTALNLMASSDFAINKPAGVPCPNLQDDFRCQIHSELRETGFKGCTVFDCLGAGQIIAQSTFGGQSWRTKPENAEKMFMAFPVMEQLFEMIAFVAEALSYKLSPYLKQELTNQLDLLQRLTKLSADELLNLDLISYRFTVSELLVKTSTEIRNQAANKAAKRNGKRELEQRGEDWMGKKLAGQDLRGTNLRGAYMIAADLQKSDLRGVDFIGADLRDANLNGANLSTSLFLTQMQINSANGNRETHLPDHLDLPSHWIA